MAKKLIIVIERRWIASSNQEWCIISPKYRRGGSLASALSKAAELIGPEGGIVQVRSEKVTS